MTTQKIREALEGIRDTAVLDKGHLREIEEAIALLDGIALAEGWQSIETAPKDRRILVWTGQTIYAAHYGQNPFINDEAWVVAQFGDDGSQAIVKPTHWMPLPAAPKEGE